MLRYTQREIMDAQTCELLSLVDNIMNELKTRLPELEESKRKYEANLLKVRNIIDRIKHNGSY